MGHLGRTLTARTLRRSAVALAVALLVVPSGACGRYRVAGSRQTGAQAALADPANPFWHQRSPDVFRVRIQTGKGDLVIEAHRDWAPIGCDRLYNLVRAAFFDDSRFFRIRRGAFAQFGIPGDPFVAAKWRTAAIPDDAVRRSNTRGSVAYAMTGPDTRTTQLFINLSDNSRLDRDGFAPVGTVVEGMEVGDRLYAGYAEDPGGGMRGGKQGKMFEGGNAYLDREFPLLDRLIRVTVAGR